MVLSATTKTHKPTSATINREAVPRKLHLVSEHYSQFKPELSFLSYYSLFYYPHSFFHPSCNPSMTMSG
ncbi:hypothetical protein GmHk_08G022804 [Glycine max]|nr:hypothetical protein GmHk_08G022804 [Glycine max]